MMSYSTVKCVAFACVLGNGMSLHTRHVCIPSAKIILFLEITKGWSKKVEKERKERLV